MKQVSDKTKMRGKKATGRSVVTNGSCNNAFETRKEKKDGGDHEQLKGVGMQTWIFENKPDKNKAIIAELLISQSGLTILSAT